MCTKSLYIYYNRIFLFHKIKYSSLTASIKECQAVDTKSYHRHRTMRQIKCFFGSKVSEICSRFKKYAVLIISHGFKVN